MMLTSVLPHAEVGNAGTIDLLHPQLMLVNAHLVSNLGGAAQAAKNQATDGLEVLAAYEELRASFLG